jgi:aryl-alcohol dehydrogenase-like predicted oxidoreductase
MDKRHLGKTELMVTGLGFGTLPMGRLQRDLPVKEGPTAYLSRQVLLKIK